MNRDALMQILPHRDGMLLLDCAERQGQYAYGSYHVRGNEWFLQGHFPEKPIVPGVILCEILAQSACVLLTEEFDAHRRPMYTGLDHVRFRAPVYPGDTLQTQCQITRARPPFYFAKGTGSVNGKRCIEAEFSFAVIEE